MKNYFKSKFKFYFNPFNLLMYLLSNFKKKKFKKNWTINPNRIHLYYIKLNEFHI